MEKHQGVRTFDTNSKTSPKYILKEIIAHMLYLLFTLYITPPLLQLYLILNQDIKCQSILSAFFIT